MFGGSRKKLQAVEALISTTQQDIASKNGELGKVVAEIERLEQETKTLEEEVEYERREQSLAEAENARLKMELEQAIAESESLKDKITKSTFAADEAREEKDRLTAELARHEEIVREEHRAVEAAADAALREAARLHAEQESERLKWQEVRNAHEDLRKQIEEAAQRCEEIKAHRDAARTDWQVAKDSYQSLQMIHKRLEQDNARTEEELKEQLSQKKLLEEELQSLDQQHRQVREEHLSLEREQRDRKFVLDSVSTNLSDKRGHLQKELVDFQEQFEKAKAHRDRIVAEQVNLRQTTNVLLPEYFQLQAEHSAKSREFEQVKRDRELMGWEQLKVQRDLGVLASTYDCGAMGVVLPPLPMPPGTAPAAGVAEGAAAWAPPGR